MKICCVFLLILMISVSFPSETSAFISFGNVDVAIDYQDFQRDGDGYNVTFVNKSANHREEFYIIVLGLDFRGAPIFRHRLYIDFLPGYGQISFFLPGYNDNIVEVRFEVRKLREFDVRPQIQQPYPAVPSRRYR
ncbi:MAG: hypothetical protein AB1512_25690 [Thermodesulfobacteriota bacterium]